MTELPPYRRNLGPKIAYKATRLKDPGAKLLLVVALILTAAKLAEVSDMHGTVIITTMVAAGLATACVGWVLEEEGSYGRDATLLVSLFLISYISFTWVF